MNIAVEQKEETRDHSKEITIIVNGRQRIVAKKELTFEEVVKLAYENPPFGDNTAYTVTYKKGIDAKPEGTMVEGDTVKVKRGMIFNVTATDKS